jgi:hypothetical protein
MEFVSSYPSWGSAQAQVLYRSRHPEQSSLYRLVYHYREEFEYSWDELFSQRYGVLRQEVLDSFDRYLSCGVLRHGCALACCENPECNHSMLVAFSCKRRGVCSSCQAKRAVLFAENLHENVLLEHSHRHLVFSLPKRLRVYFRFDRRLFSLLYRAAWQSWVGYLSGVLPEAKPGAVVALHTAGSMLNWHPHIHGIFLNGGILPDGSFIELDTVDSELLQEYFSEKIFSALRKTELLDERSIASMKSWEHSGFNVYSGSSICAEDCNARLFIGRYLKKAPLALDRLSLDETGREVVVRYAKPIDENSSIDKSEREFTPLEFLAELSVHIPRVFEQTTRWLGVYSPRSRGVAKRKEAARKKLAAPSVTPLEINQEQVKPSSSWARCMKLVFELDPLCCPKCGTEMKIKLFILNPQEIERICKYQGIVLGRAPPEFRAEARKETWLDDSVEYSQLH